MYSSLVTSESKVPFVTLSINVGQAGLQILELSPVHLLPLGKKDTDFVVIVDRRPSDLDSGAFLGVD